MKDIPVYLYRDVGIECVTYGLVKGRFTFTQNNCKRSRAWLMGRFENSHIVPMCHGLEFYKTGMQLMHYDYIHGSENS